MNPLEVSSQQFVRSFGVSELDSYPTVSLRLCFSASDQRNHCSTRSFSLIFWLFYTCSYRHLPLILDAYFFEQPRNLCLSEWSCSVVRLYGLCQRDSELIIEINPPSAADLQFSVPCFFGCSSTAETVDLSWR